MLGDRSKIGMNMLASKRNILDVRKKAMALYLLHQYEDLATMILLSKTTLGVANEIVMLKMVSKTPLQFGVAERLSRTFKAESTRLRAKALKDITFVDSIYGAMSVTDLSSLTKPIHKSTLVLVDISENLAKNYSIVAEHGLSSEITQSLGGCSNTSAGSKKSRSFKDSGRSDEQDSKDEAFFRDSGRSDEEDYEDEAFFTCMKIH
nr:hypothetical protein [Tanacetum cinerariifolium]